jgi:hypothetical protein
MQAVQHTFKAICWEFKQSHLDDRTTSTSDITVSEIEPDAHDNVVAATGPNDEAPAQVLEASSVVTESGSSNIESAFCRSGLNWRVKVD